MNTGFFPRLAAALADLSLWAALAAAPTAALAQAAEPRRLTIASEGARPPFNFVEAGELAGFEIDLAREICRRLNAQCAFVAQEWDNLVEGLARRQYDVAMAAIEITPERRREMDFSVAYVRPTAAFLVRADAVFKDATAASFAGRTIGVEEGSSAQTFAEARYQTAQMKTYGGLVEAVLDLAEDKIDLVIADEAALADFLKNRKEAQCCRLLATSPRDPSIFGEGVGAAFRKDDVALRAEFDRALVSMFDDGAFQTIARKYFSHAVR